MNVRSVRPLLIVPVLLLAAASAPRLESFPQQQSSVAGTYNIAICKRQPCSPDDTTNVVVSGVLVLSDTAYTIAAFPDTVRFSLLGDALAKRNGCSATAVRGRARGTFATIGGMELVSWSRDSTGGVVYSRHESETMAYRVRLTFSGDGFRGSGKSWGANSTIPQYTDDVLVGRRTGAPNHKPCADSAMVWLRKQ